MRVQIIRIRRVDDILRLYPETDKRELAEIEKNVSADLKEAGKGSRIVYGAKYRDKIIGTAQLVFKRSSDIGSPYIHHVRVIKSLRGKGIGLRLMQVVERTAKKKGYKILTLGVEPGNKCAIRFYKSLGYYAFKDYKGKKGEPIIGMRKTL